MDPSVAVCGSVGLRPYATRYNQDEYQRRRFSVLTGREANNAPRPVCYLTHHHGSQIATKIIVSHPRRRSYVPSKRYRPRHHHTKGFSLTGLLLNEPCIVVQPSLVRALGQITDAAVLQQLHYWMSRTSNELYGHMWVYKTTDEWANEIGVTAKQVRAAIARLEGIGVVVSCQPEKVRWQRRKWYRINYEHPVIASDASKQRSDRMGSSISPNGQVKQPISELRIAQVGESIQEITTEITSEITAVTSMFDESDATRLANLLADRIEANGSKRPTVTAKWIQTIDRMMRIDGRTPSQIQNAIEWCQADDFWRANVLSPTALRRQYDRLRLHASRSKKQPKGIDGVRAFLDRLDEIGEQQ